MKNSIFLLTVLALLLQFACQDSTQIHADLTVDELTEVLESSEFIARGDGDTENTGERSAATNEIDYESGILTAGKWSDLDAWDFWQQLMQKEMYFDFQQYWEIFPNQRYSIEITDADLKPVNDCKIELVDDKDNIIWQSRTNNEGKADLFSQPFSNYIELAKTIRVVHQNNNHSIKQPLLFNQGINRFRIPSVAEETAQHIDLMFIIDATGSMEDEINYLKNELNDVVNNVSSELPTASVKTGSIFYRDKGEEYVLRASDFSADHQQTMQFIQQQSAKDGGDYPEALDLALEAALNQEWSTSAKTRLAFMLLDAPPHHDAASIQKLQASISKAAAAGIRLIPIAASGIDKETEFLMRFSALLTNGQYVFITDHSGVGNGHLEPTIGEYRVQYLNDLLTELIVDMAKDKTTPLQ